MCLLFSCRGNTSTTARERSVVQREGAAIKAKQRERSVLQREGSTNKANPRTAAMFRYIL